jgi:diaminopimelate decarboxylase
MPPASVRDRALSARLPAYVYDLAGLRSHIAAIRGSVPAEVYYAAKANPDARLLAALAPHVDGVEVSSGGELAHVRRTLPGTRLAFGGPGKTDDDLALAAHRVHVESPHELRRLAALRRERDVLLRLNLPIIAPGAALRMNGPFGMDPEALGACLDLLAEAPWLRLRGVHAHLASGLAAAPSLEVAAHVLGWARSWLDGPAEINLGGGMAVDYTDPARRFDWAAYGRGLAALRRPGETLRIEPGRSLTAYCGWYVTDVLDVKRTHGESYAVLRGGTHHLRTPAARGHDQPFTLLPGGGGPAVRGPVTLVGQLCTPKDVFARNAPVDRVAAGDVVAFAMAGAYAWNISHHDFLMHPAPGFHYVDGPDPQPGAATGGPETAATDASPRS